MVLWIGHYLIYKNFVKKLILLLLFIPLVSFGQIKYKDLMEISSQQAFEVKHLLTISIMKFLSVDLNAQLDRASAF